MKKLLVLIFVTTITFSCNSPSRRNKEMANFANLNMDEEVMPITRQMNEPPPPPMQAEQALNNIEKKIIKDARIGVEVADYKTFRISIDSLTGVFGGYISNENLYNNNESINCDLSLRIPEKNFEKFLTILEKGSEKILYKNISARDVTEEFIDIEARLTNKKDVEKRYSQLLSRAQTVKDILEIEDKVRRIREEIESTEGRLNYLKSQVSFSTIDLSIIQKLEFKFESTKEKNFFQLLIKSLDNGWKAFLKFVLFIFKLWPFIFILAIVFYVYKKYRRRIKNKPSEIN